jgi:predicted GIY-YIG superfamily endonuclease
MNLNRGSFGALLTQSQKGLFYWSNIMHYVYTVRDKDTNSVLRVGECKDLKQRLRNYVTKPYKNKGGKSLMNGQFHGKNIELVPLKECETKDEARKWEGIFKQLLGFEWTEKKELYSKPVLAYRKDTGEFVGEFESQMEAGRQLGLHAGNVSKVIKGIVKSAGGYTFRLTTE